MSKKVKYVRASNSKSVEYWKEREDEARQRYIASEEQYDKRLKEIYDLTLDKVNKEINGFYGKYAKAEGITITEAKKRVTQIEIEEYARKAKEYVKTKDFSKEANEEMKLYNATMRINRLEMLKANIGLELVAGNNELSKEMEAMLTDRAMKEYERLSGILGDTVRLNAKDARALVNASYMNATFSQRIWTHQDMLKKEIDSLLREGIIQGRNPYVLARHLEKRFGVSRNNARRLMRTELQRVQSAAELLALEDAEYDEYQYLAEPTACPVCRVLDGKHWKLKEAEPADNLPPMHPWCRCTISAYMDDEEYEEWIEGKPTNENGDVITFEEGIPEETKKIIKRLSDEFKTRLTEVRKASASKQKAAGTIDLGGHMYVSTRKADVPIHEFAHTIAWTASDKVGLTNNKSFWKEIKKTQRDYKKDVGDDAQRWISSYEHSKREPDEFFAEAFTMAIMKEWGMDIPFSYGSDFTYANKVLAITRKYFSKK